MKSSGSCSQLLAKVSKCVIIKLIYVIRDKEPRDLEAINNVFSYEVSNVLLSDDG